MIRVIFNLKDAKSVDKTYINLFATYDCKRLKIFTKESIEPKKWNKKTGLVVDSIRVPEGAKINERLNNMRSCITNLYSKFIENYDRVPEPLELKTIFIAEYFDKIPQFTKKVNVSLEEAFLEYIETKKANGQESTHKKYAQGLENLKEFCALKRVPFMFESIDASFRNKYLNYLQEVKGYAGTTVYRKFSLLKTVLNYAKDCGYIERFSFPEKQFLPPDYKAVKIALSESELNAIKGLNLTSRPALAKVRDRFLLGCYTGARFSDYGKFNKGNLIEVNGKQYLSYIQTKTKQPVTIPLTDDIRSIFAQYAYNLPTSITEQKFNAHLKEICKMVDLLTVEVSISAIAGGKELKSREYKYNLITSHTARRTFVSLQFAKGMPLNMIQIFSGHESIKQLQAYIKLNDVQRADVAALAYERANNGGIVEVKTAKVVNL